MLNHETGKVIKTFSGLSEACDEFDISLSNIWHAIEKKKGVMPVKKLRFEYAEERVNNTKRKVRQLDYETGELIETYNNMEEAASDNFISLKALRKALSKRGGYNFSFYGIRQCNKSNWRKKEDFYIHIDQLEELGCRPMKVYYF
ncbi:MAG: hypothetical protein H9893_06230 [Candidatus Niameybacter stercoravium]|nr:hypothetical protein [Candidatus Niameybacter stercoravium]